MYIIDNVRQYSNKSPVLISLARNRFRDIVGNIQDDAEVLEHIDSFGYIIGITKA